MYDVKVSSLSISNVSFSTYSYCSLSPPSIRILSNGFDILTAYSMVLHGDICDPQASLSRPVAFCVTEMFFASVPEIQKTKKHS